MKIDRFDEAIKSKVDLIQYESTDAEVSNIYDYVVSHRKTTLIQKLVYNKYKIIFPLLVLSMILNVWLWTAINKPISKTDSSSVKLDKPTIERERSSKEMDNETHGELNLPNHEKKPTNETIASYQSAISHHLSPKYNAKTIDENNNNALILKNKTNALMIYGSNLSSIPNEAHAIRNENNNKFSQTIEATARYAVNGVDQQTNESHDIKGSVAAEAIQLLPTLNAKHYLTSIHAEPNISLALTLNEIHTIKPVSNGRWNVGLNTIANNQELAYGILGMYNVNSSISVSSSIQHAISYPQHYKTVASYLSSNDINSSETFNVDFSDYNNITDIRAHNQALLWTIGSQYKSKLWHDIYWLGGASASFRLAAQSHLSFKHLPIASQDYKSEHFDAREDDVNLQWLSANLGIGKKIRHFDLQLLYNASAEHFNHGHRSQNLEVRSSAEVRLLYGF